MLLAAAAAAARTKNPRAYFQSADKDMPVRARVYGPAPREVYSLVLPDSVYGEPLEKIFDSGESSSMLYSQQLPFTCTQFTKQKGRHKNHRLITRQGPEIRENDI